MIEDILSRLDKVKATKPNEWVACCPAHNDNKPSMGIKLTDDGKILMKCLSQHCSINDIVAAIGLELSDLFPDSVKYERNKRQYFSASTILKAIQFETTIILLSSADVLNKTVKPGDHARIELAYERIQDAITYCKKV
jgi:hypothetical protein